jgi:membrane protease YdiL (CAAX protease family)
MALWDTLNQRAEAVFAALAGLAMVALAATSPSTLTILGLAFALVYLLVTWCYGQVVRVPAQPIRPPHWRRGLAWGFIVSVAFLAATMATRAMFRQAGNAAQRQSSLLAPLIILALFSLGFATLPAVPWNLLPLIRAEDRRAALIRLVYVIAAAPFLGVVVQMAGAIGMGIAQGLSGEPNVTQQAAQALGGIPAWQLFLRLLLGAGIAEELMWRVGVMTAVWALTRRWWIGLLVSSLAFGAYHLTPGLNSLAEIFWQMPWSQFTASAATGLVLGTIYRYRGLEAAILAHVAIDFVGILSMGG